MATTTQLGVHVALPQYQAREHRTSLLLSSSCNRAHIWHRFAPATLKCERAGGASQFVRKAAAVVPVENYVSASPSLGEITKGDFPILDQVATLSPFPQFVGFPSFSWFLEICDAIFARQSPLRIEAIRHWIEICMNWRLLMRLDRKNVTVYDIFQKYGNEVSPFRQISRIRRVESAPFQQVIRIFRFSRLFLILHNL